MSCHEIYSKYFSNQHNLANTILGFISAGHLYFYIIYIKLQQSISVTGCGMDKHIYLMFSHHGNTNSTDSKKKKWLYTSVTCIQRSVCLSSFFDCWLPVKILPCCSTSGSFSPTELLGVKNKYVCCINIIFRSLSSWVSYLITYFLIKKGNVINRWNYI